MEAFIHDIATGKTASRQKNQATRSVGRSWWAWCQPVVQFVAASQSPTIAPKGRYGHGLDSAIAGRDGRHLSQFPLIKVAKQFLAAHFCVMPQF